MKERRCAPVSDLERDSVTDGMFYDELEVCPADDSVSRALSTLRCSRKLTQEELADRAGCTQSKISRIENSGNDRLKLDDLAMYARAFNMQVSIDFAPESSSADAAVRLARQIRNGLDNVTERVRHEGTADEGAKKAYETFLFEMLDLFMGKLEGLRAQTNGSPESGKTTGAGNGRPSDPMGRSETSHHERRKNGSTEFRIYTPIDVSNENGRTGSQPEQ